MDQQILTSKSDGLGDSVPCEYRARLCQDPDSICGQTTRTVRPEIEVRHQERSRMGRELHDSTAQALVVLQLKIMYLKEMFDDDRSRGLLADVEETIHELHSEIRAISYISSLPALQEGMLPAALSVMSAKFGKLTGLRIAFHWNGTYASCPADAESSIYRIAQEALANVYRHAQASSVHMDLESTSNLLRLVVEDDGVGIGHMRRVNPSGVGLQNIRQRARELGGRLDFRCLKRGSRFAVTIPRGRLLDQPTRVQAIGT